MKPKGIVELPAKERDKLRKIRDNAKKPTREQMQFIVDCFDKYYNQNISRQVGYTSENAQYFRTLLYGNKINEIKESNLDILDFSVEQMFEYLNPHFNKPIHLRQIYETFDLIIGTYRNGRINNNDEIRWCFSTPPRSGKTESMVAFISLMLLNRPHLEILYVSNNKETAQYVNEKVKSVVSLYAKLSDSKDRKESFQIKEWIVGEEPEKIVCGGGLKTYTALSVPQGITCSGCLIIDDMYSSADASNNAYRNRVNKAIMQNAFSRVLPNTPMILISTRYAIDDLYGILTREQQWQSRNVPAIKIDAANIERSYFPSLWKVEKLQEKRKNSTAGFWQAVYMGNPIVEEESMFKDICFVEEIPDTATKVYYTIDMAYTNKDYSDFTVMFKWLHDQKNERLFVAESFKWQLPIEQSLAKVKQIVQSSNIPIYWITGGMEPAIVRLARTNYKINMIHQSSRGEDKIKRAGDASIFFHKVEFHHKIPKEIIEEIQLFPGGTRHDDAVDAFVTGLLNSQTNQASNLYQLVDFSGKNSRDRNDQNSNRSFGYSR